VSLQGSTASTDVIGKKGLAVPALSSHCLASMKPASRLPDHVAERFLDQHAEVVLVGPAFNGGVCETVGNRLSGKESVAELKCISHSIG
jgi:hypothetical protein